jgi:hypothetical protein
MLTMSKGEKSMVSNIIQEYGSEFDWESNNRFINDNLSGSAFPGAEFFRSGRDALKAIALKNKDKYKRVLLPALCCESMVTPFEMNGYVISYFKLNQDISANFGDILTKLDSDTIFIYMNYFGITSLSYDQLCMLQKQFQGLLMIEDRTQDILNHRNSRFIPDYTVCSIRKWLAVPDGGILYSRLKQVGFPKEEDTYFGEVRTVALKNKSEYLRTGNAQIKKEYRNKLEKSNAYLEMDEAVVDMSPCSFELLQKINFNEIVKFRIENTKILSQKIKDITCVKSIVKDTQQSGLYYPILIENRDEIQRKLAEKNIYCPVIWPLPRTAGDVCHVSNYLSKNMLALPCDQRYRKSEIEYIVDVLGQLLEKN